MRPTAGLVAVVGTAALVLGACSSGGSDSSKGKDRTPTTASAAPTTRSSVPPSTDPNYHPVIDPARFTTRITNPYFPLKPGTTLVYEGTRDGKPQHDEVVITTNTRKVLGVDCVVVEDTVTSNGALVEKTSDWYAQSTDGDVWYFGEDTKEYENGVVSSTHGTWEAGVDGAQPGVTMKAHPEIGVTYRQEYRPGEAEDQGKSLRYDPTLKIPAGTYRNALVTLDSDPLNPDKNDNKWYVSGIGLAQSVRIKTGHSEQMALIEVRTR